MARNVQVVSAMLQRVTDDVVLAFYSALYFVAVFVLRRRRVAA